MIKSILVAIGLIAMTAIIATTGIANASTLPPVTDLTTLKRTADKAAADSLRQTSSQITNTPGLSDEVRSIITGKMNEAITQLVPPGCESWPQAINDNCHWH